MVRTLSGDLRYLHSDTRIFNSSSLASAIGNGKEAFFATISVAIAMHFEAERDAVIFSSS